MSGESWCCTGCGRWNADYLDNCEECEQSRRDTRRDDRFRALCEQVSDIQTRIAAIEEYLKPK